MRGIDMMLHGFRQKPETWIIEELNYNDIECMQLNPDWFYKEFPTFLALRKFVLDEIKARRKELGRLMFKWIVLKNRYPSTDSGFGKYSKEKSNDESLILLPGDI
jgi:hypothetical protein